MNLLVETLYFLSTALLVPVIVALLAMVAWTLLEIGGFLRETRERHQRRPVWESLVREMHRVTPSGEQAIWAAFFQPRAFTGLLAAFSVRGRAFYRSELHLGKLMSDLEIEAASRLARMNFGVRVGPMLGLMGTLIPLGPALIGLSTGNIQEMARHLVVAFGTTVLGLLVGGICYGLWLVRRQWYARDLADIEYVYHCLHSAEKEPADGSGNAQSRHETLLASTVDREP